MATPAVLPEEFIEQLSGMQRANQAAVKRTKLFA